MIMIDKGTVCKLHTMMTKATGGDDGLRDEGLLDAAINMPFASFGGEDLYPTLASKAARLCHSLVKNHPFVDGNKRIGVFAMLTFLKINGAELDIKEGEVASLGLGTADGSLGYDEILEWIKLHTK